MIPGPFESDSDNLGKLRKAAENLIALVRTIDAIDSGAVYVAKEGNAVTGRSIAAIAILTAV
jgi:hypothetical protein